jgi:presenilin-like A22 family membrane protease
VNKRPLSVFVTLILVVLNALVYMLNNRYRIGYYCALALFITITFLTFLDQVGWSDLVILAINIAPIVLLIKERSWYLQNESAKQ